MAAAAAPYPSSRVGSANARKSEAPAYYKPAPAEIQYGPMRFLITERPSDVTMSAYLDECAKHNVNKVVRVCEPTYNTQALRDAGIEVLDWEFSDGSPPPTDIRQQWLTLARGQFAGKTAEHPCIAVHCVAGLGRAPVMVAIALMEAGVKYEDAVEMIRKVRRGALNQKQLKFLEKYKPSGELKKLAGKNGGKDCCIM